MLKALTKNEIILLMQCNVFMSFGDKEHLYPTNLSKCKSFK